MEAVSPSLRRPLSDSEKARLLTVNRVYLLGAGFSKAISNAMPVMTALSDAVAPRVKQFTPRDAAMVPGLGTPITKNFERWLSYLVEAPPWLPEPDQARNKAAFLDVSLTLYQVLSEFQDAALSEQGPQWLANLVRLWQAESATVITFNYDLLIELAWLLYCDGASVLQLYPVPITPIGARLGNALAAPTSSDGLKLLKLHGSLNWRYSGIDGAPADTIYGLPISREHSGWQGKGIHYTPERHESLTVDLQPMIVPPATVKSPYYTNRTLQALWRMAAEALGRASELVVIGFSIPATDLLTSAMLATETNKKCTITLVDINNEIMCRANEVFTMDASAIVDIFKYERTLNADFVRHEDAVQAWVQSATGSK